MKTKISLLRLILCSFLFLLSEKSFAQLEADEETPIIGSGIINYVPVFVGTQEIGTSAIYQNGSNIGISNTSPGAKLDINGTLRTNNNISLWNGTTTLLNFTSGVSYFKGGNVGIGEVSPQDKLQITQTVSDKPGLIIKNTGGSAGFQLTGSAGSTWKVIAGGSAFAMYDVSNLQYRFWINNSNGNVGIGETSPAEKLVVNGNIKTPYGGRIILGDAGNAYIQGYAAGQDLDGLKFFTPQGYSGGSMIITNEGRIGIGKSPNPIYYLDVNGKIRANEIVVNTTGADFVFDKDYKLKSLNEVETFIKENKHLPDMPSAKDMQEDGMSVSEINTKLLQKVEELTLYIIEQNKQFENLKIKIAELKEELK